MKLGKKNGEIARAYQVEDDDELMMVTNGGQIIRMPVTNIRFVGRQTMGVTLFKVSGGEEVVSAALIARENSEEVEIEEEEGAKNNEQ